MSTTILMARAVTQAFTVVWGKPNRIVVPAFTKNDLIIRLNIVDEAGDPVDVSSYTTRNFGCYPPASGTADFTATPAFLTDGIDGVVTVTITDSNTSAFTTGNKRFEVQLAKTGSKITVVDGVIQFTATKI